MESGTPEQNALVPPASLSGKGQPTVPREGETGCHSPSQGSPSCSHTFLPVPRECALCHPCLRPASHATLRSLVLETSEITILYDISMHIGRQLSSPKGDCIALGKLHNS